jgi:hypothetical protein
MTAYPIPNSNGRIFRPAPALKEPPMLTHEPARAHRADCAAYIAAGTYRRCNCAGPRVYERIINAHYAQAEKMDEARAGANAERHTRALFPSMRAMGPIALAQLAWIARDGRRTRDTANR